MSGRSAVAPDRCAESVHDDFIQGPGILCEYTTIARDHQVKTTTVNEPGERNVANKVVRIKRMV